MRHKRGFTLIELLLVIAIISILITIIFIAINPTKNLAEAEDSRRISHARSIKSAIEQYAIDTNQEIETITAVATPICAYAAADTTGCINLDILATSNYVPSLASDGMEQNANHLGYSVHKDARGFYVVIPLYLSKYYGQ